MNPKHIPEIKAAIEALPPKDASLRFLVAEIEVAIRDAIVVKRYSFGDIAKVLAKYDVAISPGTLRAYLGPRPKKPPKRNGGSVPAEKPKKPKPSSNGAAEKADAPKRLANAVLRSDEL